MPRLAPDALALAGEELRRHGRGIGAAAVTRVVINQSAYLPWKGYFDLMRDADVFVFYDDAQFSSGSWRNRNLGDAESRARAAAHRQSSRPRAPPAARTGWTCRYDDPARVFEREDPEGRGEGRVKKKGVTGIPVTPLQSLQPLFTAPSVPRSARRFRHRRATQRSAHPAADAT